MGTGSGREVNERVQGWLPLSAILANDEEALSLGQPLVQVSRCEETSATIGVSQSEEVLRSLRAALPGVEVLQRPSGGSGLLHQRGDIFWSVVLPREGSWVGRDFIHQYSRFGGGWEEFLRERGIQAAWEKAPELFPPYCLLSGRGEVLRTQGRILGGASQHLTSKGLLHHGTVSLTLDREAIQRAFSVPSPLTAEHLTSVTEEGANLVDRDLETLASLLARALRMERA